MQYSLLLFADSNKLKRRTTTKIIGDFLLPILSLLSLVSLDVLELLFYQVFRYLFYQLTSMAVPGDCVNVPILYIFRLIESVNHIYCKRTNFRGVLIFCYFRDKQNTAKNNTREIDMFTWQNPRKLATAKINTFTIAKDVKK